ncbi:MFS transporter [Lactobacillus pasteurii]
MNLFILSLGTLLRMSLRPGLLLLGTMLIGLGIDGGNVLLPAIIKAKLPKQVLLGVSLYTTSMILTSSLGTAFLAGLAMKFSLATTMKGLFVFSLLSIVGSLLLKENTIKTATEAINLPALLRNKLVWLISLFFGLQALLYYSLTTWYGQILLKLDRFSTKEEALLMTILQLSCLFCALLTPIFARNSLGKRFLISVIGVGFGLGVVGLCLGSNNLIVGIILALLVGVASGFSFNLAVIFFTQKTASSRETVAVSGIAQTLGYLLASLGPVIFGRLYTMTGTWQSVILICLFLAILIAWCGFQIEKFETI